MPATQERSEQGAKFVAGHDRSDSGAKVTVACKLPNGLVLRAFEPREEREAVMGGGTREYTIYRPKGEPIDVHGPAVRIGDVSKCQVVCGYALTPNVSKDLWDAWFAANKDTPVVRNKMVFAYESLDQVQGRARENESRQTGFESIDPNDPGKKVRGIAKGERK